MKPKPRFTIHHVGLAVPSIERFLAKHAAVYGDFARGEPIVNAQQRVNEVFLSDGGTTLELLEPLGAGSPLEGFLQRNRSGGLVHVALEVDDLDAALKEVVAAGAILVQPPTPDVAFGNRPICFVAIDGLLTELIQRPK